MKFKIAGLLLSLLLILALTGCDSYDSPIQRFINQVEIGNTFSDFAPGYSNVLAGARDLSSRAERSLASRVSQEILIEDIELDPEIATIKLSEIPCLNTQESFELSIVLENVSKADFVDFLQAEDVDDVKEELQEEWVKFDNLISQEITDVRIFHEDVDFDEAPEFDSDTVSKIRRIIDVSNNTGSLQAQISMKINEVDYEGIIKAGFTKSGNDWKVSGIEINLEKK